MAEGDENAPCFSLVCLRQLEETVPLDKGNLQAASLSHDRRLLSLRDRENRCLCYTCDAARPAFLLRQPMAENVEQDVWLHLPAEKSVQLHQNALSEYLGMPCLVALQKGNVALTVCIFSRIESPETKVVDAQVRLAAGPVEIAMSKLLFTWEEEMHSEELPPNTVSRYNVPLAEIIALFPSCLYLLEQNCADSGQVVVGDSCDSEPPSENREEEMGERDGEQAESSSGSPAHSPRVATCQHFKVRLSVAKPSSLALIVDDVMALLLDFGRHGVFVSHCFFLQRPQSSLKHSHQATSPGNWALSTPTTMAPSTQLPGALPGTPSVSAAAPRAAAPLRFCDLVASQDWLFAVTPSPEPLLLIWSLTGVAFHAISLGDYVAEGTHFVSLVVALDLLGVTLCDNRHDVWILALNKYFDGCPKGLDWDLFKERQRCAEGVGVLEQTGKAFQELSCFPEAFGFSAHRSNRAGGRSFARRSGNNSSVMDCLVEGVPTYGIPICGGSFGVGDMLFHDSEQSSEPLKSMTGFDTEGRQNRNQAQMCSPVAWQERMSQTHEWHEVDRPWVFTRAERLSMGNRGKSGTGVASGYPGAFGYIGMSSPLNGFSVPAQHRLGDDDLHYGLCAALRKHAQRQFESRLPPWLSRVSLLLKAQRFNPPMLGTLRSTSTHGDEVDSDSSFEAETDVEYEDQVDGGRAEMTPTSGFSESREPQSISTLRQELTEAIGGHRSVSGTPAPAVHGPAGTGNLRHGTVRRSRPPIQVARVKLSITTTDVVCEIWKKSRSRTKGARRDADVGTGDGDGDRDTDGAESTYDICPWGVCVIPRLASAPSNTISVPQVDHLTGGILDPLLDGNKSADMTAPTHQIATLRSPRRWMSLVTQNHVWYMLDEDGRLYALLLRQSPARVISNLLVFEHHAKASQLCALNGWNATQLPVLTLFLGLRFRELNEIRHSLCLLRPHQEMEACQMVMDFIHAGYSCASLALPFSPSSPRQASAASGHSNARGTPICQPSMANPQQPLVRKMGGGQDIHQAWADDGEASRSSVPWAVSSPLTAFLQQQQQAPSLQSSSLNLQEQQQGSALSQQHPVAGHGTMLGDAGSIGLSNSLSPQTGHSAGSQMPADRSFVSRLLEIAMQFVTKLIQTRVVLIQGSEGACRALTYLQPTHAASEPPAYAAMVHELSQLTVHMQSLRALQQQLIWSFGDDKAYDGGIVIQCPPQEDADQLKSVSVKNGLTSLDAAVTLATKPQTSGENAVRDSVLRDKEQLGKLRSAESREAIVRSALISGRVSSALIWFHELAQEEGRIGRDGGSKVFEEFRVTAGRLAYQLVCNQQVDFLFAAMHMLRNVGESVNRFFKALAFHTAKRLVRQRLLKHLRHMSRLTKEEQALISLVNLLETLYTNPCYTTEFNRMTTSLNTGRYPQRAHQKSLPPFCTWPAGGRKMLVVGLNCDGAVGGSINVEDIAGENAISDRAYEQQTSLRELPIAQRMPLELHDMWAGFQTPVMAAMLEVSNDARRAWARLPCGDVDDLDAQPVLGLANFHKASNLEGDQEAAIADMQEVEGGEPDTDGLLGSRSFHAGSRTTCRHCQKEGIKDDLDFEVPPRRSSGSRYNSDGKSIEFCEALGLGFSGPKHHVMGYLHVTLSWMRRWSWATRARILMEKTHFQSHLIESLPWLQPPPEEGPPEQAWRRCWLDFLVAHQDWRGLASWVRCMPLDWDDRVDSCGMSKADLTHLEERSLPCCTSYTREILLQELGRRGIFCREDTQSFSALLRRLAQCGRLFGEGSISAGKSTAEEGDDGQQDSSEGSGKDVGVLPLDRLLPARDVCPFHRFFIHLCIDRDLPTVMLLYLQNYKLATTMGDLKALQLRHSTKPWASLLLVGRLGNAHLFAASLQHAAIVFGGTDQAGGDSAGTPSQGRKSTGHAPTWHDAESVPLMPLNGLATRSPKAFLATLMFAPVASAFDAAEAPTTVPWHVDLNLVWQVVQEYPTLREALFPIGAAIPPEQGEVSEPTATRKLETSLVESVAEASQRRWAHNADFVGDTVLPGSKDSRPEQSGGCGASDGGDGESAGARRSSNAMSQGEQPRPLDDMLTFKEDVSLSQLLGDVAAFNVRHALWPLPIFRDDGADGPDRGVVKVTKDGSLAALVEHGERFCDELGEGYFLAQGRAMMAFHAMLTKCARRADPSGELRFPLMLPTEEKRRLHKVAKSVALCNLLNEGVVSSAVCLLELCSLDTEMLRVDVQAAKRIYEHNVRQGREATSAEDWDLSRQAAANVIDLFLSFPDIEDMPSRAAEAAINSGHLLTALRMLEESTWALDPHPSAPSVSSLQALAYDSPWHLVALFCRVHSLPRSLTLLHELARNNDWVMFLHEGDLQQCPADTVLDIVDGYFTDVSLQSHLRILARSIAVQDDHDLHLKAIKPGIGGQEGGAERIARQPEEPRTEDAGLKQRAEPSPGRMSGNAGGGVADAIGFLERCRGKDIADHGLGTGWGLLRHALGNRAARLAVMASAFSDVTPLQCMAVWLSVNTERSQNSAAPVEPAPAEVTVQSSPAEVAVQIATLCRKSRAFSLVLRALKIFDPSNPLVDFVKFHRAFVQCRFQNCRGHLKRFVQRRDSEPRASPQQRGDAQYCLELVPYVTSLSEEMVQYLLDGFPQARMMLLTVLDQANFSPHYSHLFRSFRLIQQSGLNVDFRVPAGELLQLLISRKMFAEAREWARSSGIVSDTIVFEEVTGMIVEFRQGVWWNVLDERLQLWHECYCAFMRQNYPPVGAAHFFLDITSKLEPDLFAREQLMLLCIAFELFRGSAAADEAGATRNVGAPDGGPAEGVSESLAKDASDSSRSKQLAVPSKEQLSRIKLSMLLILTGSNKDLAAELDFAPLDLSYDTLRTLARRIPEGVQALPLYSTEGNAGSGAVAGIAGSGASGQTSGPGGLPVLAPEQRGGGPRSELLPHLETSISSLINCNEIAWTKRLASGFCFASVDLHLAEVLEKVASGNHEEALMELTSGRSHPELPSVEDGDAAPLLKSLCTQCSDQVALFCRRCQVFYAVSRSIGMDYRQVSQVDVGELLDRLLSPRPFMGDISLCRSLLSCYPKALNKAMLAEVLARRFLRSTLSLGGLEWPEATLDEFVSLLEGSPELLGDAALRGIPHYRHASQGGASVSPGAGRAATEERSPGVHESDASETSEPLPLECEVEVLIMAYRAYVQACHERSIGELLQFLRGRVEVYVEVGQFSLLVRLLAAIPEYHATEYMFGYLVRSGELDLLMEKGRSCSSVGPALPVALVRYLHEHFPRNLELLAKVHLCFGLEAQLADLLEHKAKTLALSIGRKWERICSEEGEETLLMCLSLFLQCSRFYLRGKRYQKHFVANELAALVSLQLKAVQIHLAASLQEQQQQASAAALRKAERAKREERELLSQRDPVNQAIGDVDGASSTVSTSAAARVQAVAIAAEAELHAPLASLGEGSVLASATSSLEAISVEDRVATVADNDPADPDCSPEASVVGAGAVPAVTPATSMADTEEQATVVENLGGILQTTAHIGLNWSVGSAQAFFGGASQKGGGNGEGEDSLIGPNENTAGASNAGNAGGVAFHPATVTLVDADGATDAQQAPAFGIEPSTAHSVADDDELEGVGGGSTGAPLGPMGDPFVVINLEAAEVRVFAEYHNDFVAAFQVVSAYKHLYGPSLSTVWPFALYRQVVLLGNRVYLQHFMLHLPLGRDVLEVTVRLYNDEPCPEAFPLRAQRMKQFLRDGVSNYETLYQLTRQLGSAFADISMETASLVYMA